MTAMSMSFTRHVRRIVWCLAFCGLLAGCAVNGLETESSDANTAQTTPVRPHAYAFDRPELFSAQRTFGVGYAITLLGDACANDTAASESYSNWQDENMTVLQRLSARLAEYYRINIDATQPGLQRRRVAQAMHLRARMALSSSRLAEACASLPETLALPHMNLARRYQITLAEAQRPDFLRPRRGTQSAPKLGQESAPTSPAVPVTSAAPSTEPSPDPDPAPYAPATESSPDDATAAACANPAE